VTEQITVAAAARAALAARAGGPAVIVAAAVDPAGNVRRMLCTAAECRGTLGAAALDELAQRHAHRLLADPVAQPRSENVEIGGHAWLLYLEAHRPHDHLVIVGAGHIAVPVAKLGQMLGFRVTVLDDREEFATTDRFPDEATVCRTDFTVDPFAGVSIDEHSYVALLTRGHQWDFDCLRRLLEKQPRPRYIGMIGSRRRVRAAFHALLAAGTPRDTLTDIHAPIGIEVNAETPEEIAVAIAAELIAVRRGADTESMSTRARVLERLLPDVTAEEGPDAR
jgi:xanthine/CO dehydrogenase XdhC/CoxF family maturation factor